MDCVPSKPQCGNSLEWMMNDLRKAAQAVIDRWDSPDWKDGTHTADYINALRAALAEPTVKPDLTVQPPNVEGETMCVVRWMAETPHGWVGSYDKAALDCLEVKP